MQAFPPREDWWDCLAPELKLALATTGDEERRLALRALCATPRAGNAHVLTCPVLTPRACAELRRAVLLDEDGSDALRAGAGRESGGSRHAPTTPRPPAAAERQRWFMRNEFSAWLYTSVLRPLAAASFGTQLLEPSTAPPSHHAYVLNYRRRHALREPPDGDEDDDATRLRFHTDDADVTVNISLGPTSQGPTIAERGRSANAWSGGDLVFCDDDAAAPRRPGTPDEAEERAAGRLWRCEHVCGTAVLHDGTAYHAAESLKSGERTQLIFWCLGNDARWKRTFYGELEDELLLASRRHGRRPSSDLPT